MRSRLARSGIAADEPIAETLILIVSELVTNAVVHTGCPAVLRILLRGAPDTAPVREARAAGQAAREAAPRDARDARSCLPDAGQDGPDARCGSGIVVGSVRVEVADACARPPRPRQVDGDETGGRGLALVDGLADRWGWEPSGAGKRIWCELDRGTPAAAPPRMEMEYENHTAYESMAAYEAV